MTNVFVYGSLMSGFGANYLLEGAKVQPEACVLWEGMTLIDTGCGWPAIIPVNTPAVPVMFGECYTIPRATVGSVVKRLDTYEGAPELFNRRNVGINVEKASVPAAVYVFSRNDWRDDQYRIVLNGNWRSYLDDKDSLGATLQEARENPDEILALSTDLVQRELENTKKLKENIEVVQFIQYYQERAEQREAVRRRMREQQAVFEAELLPMARIRYHGPEHDFPEPMVEE